MAVPRTVYSCRGIFSSLCVLLFFSLSSPANAQQKTSSVRTPSIDWIWHSDSLHYTVGEQLRLPSLLVFAPGGKPSEVGAAYSSKSSYPSSLASIPRREEGYALFAQGAKDSKRFALRGAAQFSKKTERDLSQNLSNHSDRFYPFIVSDTVRQDTKSEIYTLSFDAGYRLNSLFSIGISAGYEGEIRYGRKDPRVQNISSIIDGASSVSLDLRRFGILTGGATIQNEIQQLSYSVLVPHSTQLIYIMRPLGEYNFRYSGKNDSGAYRHKYTALSGQGAWLLPYRNTILGVAHHRTSARLETKDAGVYLSELTGRGLNGYFRVDIWRWSRSSLSLHGAYDKSSKEGEERIYRREQIDEHSSLTKAVLVASHKNYTESHSGAATGIEWKMSSPNSIFSVALDYGEVHFDARHRTEPLFSSFDRKGMSSTIALRLKSRSGRLYSHTILGTIHLLSEQHSQQLNKEQPTYIIEQDRQLRRRGADDVYSLQQELRFPMGADRRNAIVVGAVLQLHHWRGSGDVFQGSCKVAYAF